MPAQAPASSTTNAPGSGKADAAKSPEAAGITEKSTNAAVAETFELPASVPDPLEPMNRVFWEFNKGLMRGAVRPTAKVYRFVVPRPVRSGISNVGRNVTYPGRLINNLLQGKWQGAQDETHRFFCNTFVGVGGFFDVATKWKIPKADADFGETFGQWGWKPHCYIMLPIGGPSNERDALGLAADTAANPLLYVIPYKVNPNNPLTYFGPYTYFHYGVMYNDMSDKVEDYVRFSQAQMDPYAELQYAWTFAREIRVADFEVKGEREEASLETVESVFFACQDPEFPARSKTRAVRLTATGKDLKFTFWLQPSNAPVVYIVPGLGSHRLAQSSQALAELAFNHGFSAVCVSSTFNSEFMENAASTALPAFLPVDGQDLHVALTAVDDRLRRLFPGRVGKSALMGYSMGALHTLFIASTASTNAFDATDSPRGGPLMKFERFVAINPPVRMAHGMAMLDEYYRAPLEWPTAERTENLENTFLKVAALSKGTLTPSASLPFSAVESRFLVGLTFRLMLRDIIYSSQRRHDQGVLEHKLGKWRREPVYHEIMENSWRDYYEKFVIPYYTERGLTETAQALEKAGDLKTYEQGLRANANIRVTINQNDFLLADEDLQWFSETFDEKQLTVFIKGGHLGNLANPVVQKTIVEALSGLGAVPPKTPSKKAPKKQAPNALPVAK